MKERKERKCFRGIKTFSVQVIKKLHCHAPKLVHSQYISCSAVGFSLQNYVAAIEIMSPLFFLCVCLVNSLSGVSISSEPNKQKRHWHCIIKDFCVYLKSYSFGNIQHAYRLFFLILWSPAKKPQTLLHCLLWISGCVKTPFLFSTPCPEAEIYFKSLRLFVPQVGLVLVINRELYLCFTYGRLISRTGGFNDSFGWLIQ